MGSKVCLSECISAMVQRFTCGVYVVNDHDSLELSKYPLHILSQRKGIVNVGRACRSVEAALARPVLHAAEQRSIGSPSRTSKPSGQQLRLIEAAPEGVVTVTRHGGDEDVRSQRARASGAA